MSNKSQRPIDITAKETMSWWDKSFVFIKKTEIKAWQAIFITAFVTGVASALVWGVSTDRFSSSKAAGSISIPSNTCIARPAGGSFASPTPVVIGCGSNVVKAYYQWGTMKPVQIQNRKAATRYPAEQDMALKIFGVYKGGYGYGYGGFREFRVVYDFKVKQNLSCTDSDGGLNYYVKGMTSGNHEDTCFKDKSWAPGVNYDINGLYEMYCCDLGSGMQTCTKDYSCPNGCSSGACVVATTTCPTSANPLNVVNDINQGRYNGLEYLYIIGKYSNSNIIMGDHIPYLTLQDNQYWGNEEYGPANFTLVIFNRNKNFIGTLPERNFTINVDGNIKTVYLPAIEYTNDEGFGMIAFYISSDGSTYYAKKDHKPTSPDVYENEKTNSVDLSPSEAFTPEHLARCSK